MQSNSSNTLQQRKLNNDRQFQPSLVTQEFQQLQHQQYHQYPQFQLFQPFQLFQSYQPIRQPFQLSPKHEQSLPLFLNNGPQFPEYKRDHINNNPNSLKFGDIGTSRGNSSKENTWNGTGRPNGYSSSVDSRSSLESSSYQPMQLISPSRDRTTGLGLGYGLGNETAVATDTTKSIEPQPQPQYQRQYQATTVPASSSATTTVKPTSGSTSDSNLFELRKFKTKLCRHWKSGYCLFGPSCVFAHGVDDLCEPSLLMNVNVNVHSMNQVVPQPQPPFSAYTPNSTKNYLQHHMEDKSNGRLVRAPISTFDRPAAEATSVDLISNSISRLRFESNADDDSDNFNSHSDPHHLQPLEVSAE